MQVTQLFIILGATLLSMLLPAEAQPSWPIETCRPPIICTRRSPRVCTRNWLGNCMWHKNICDMLIDSYRGYPFMPITFSPTSDLECRNVRGTGARSATKCYRPCPRRLRVCPPAEPGQSFCIRTRDRRYCQIVANSCQLENKNCFTRPLNNWVRTLNYVCFNMQLGERAQPCPTGPTPLH